MRRLFYSTAVIVALVGCGGDEAAQLAKGTDAPKWPSLDALTETETWFPIKMNSDMGNFTELRKAVDNPDFIKKFEQFEKDPIPSKYSTPEREEAHKDMIKHYRALIDGAKSGAPDADLKAHVDGFAAALEKQQKTAPQAPPTAK